MFMMRAFSVAVLSAFGMLAMSSGSLAAATMAPDCTLSFDPGAVSPGDEMLEIQAEPSTDLGHVDGVTADRGSGLRVTLVSTDAPFELHLDPGAANSGEWSVALTSDGEEVCTGILLVD